MPCDEFSRFAEQHKPMDVAFRNPFKSPTKKGMVSCGNTFIPAIIPSSLRYFETFY